MGVIIYGSSLCFGHVRSLFCPLLPLPVWLLLWEGISVRPGPLFLVIRKSDFYFFFGKIQRLYTLSYSVTKSAGFTHDFFLFLLTLFHTNNLLFHDKKCFSRDIFFYSSHTIFFTPEKRQNIFTQIKQKFHQNCFAGIHTREKEETWNSFSTQKCFCL